MLIAFRRAISNSQKRFIRRYIVLIIVYTLIYLSAEKEAFLNATGIVKPPLWLVVTVWLMVSCSGIFLSCARLVDPDMIDLLRKFNIRRSSTARGDNELI